MIDALAPTNFVLGNPTVIKKALDTGGLSLAKGRATSFMICGPIVVRRSRSSPGAHEVGEDMAATPGKVVFRNELMELIQYAPQTEQVHETPLLFSPPWINKYYVMDLAPGRSFVEWAVAARPHRLRDQLPQSRPSDMRDVDDGRLPAPRADDRARRHPRHHRRGEGQPASGCASAAR